MPIILNSPWRPQEDRANVVLGQRQLNYSDKIYECVWDLGVHGAILSLMNVIAIFVITRIRKDSSLMLKRGVIQAGVSTLTYLVCVEVRHCSSGKNMRKLPYFSIDKIAALVFTTILTPFLSYGYERFFIGRHIQFLPLLAFSFYNSAGLVMIPYL